MSGATNGSIFPFTNPSGKKVYKVQVPVGHYLNGLRKFATRTAPTLAEAKALHRGMIADIEHQKLTPAREDTLEKFAIWWVRSVKANHVRPSTASDYEYRLRHLILPYLGKYKLSAIDPAIIETWMNALKRQGLGTATVNGARTILNGVLGYAHKSGVITRNSTAMVSPHKRKYGDKTQVQEPWSSEELTNALIAVHHTKFDLLTHLGALHGLRRGEILGLKWSDIDESNGTITIRRTLKEFRTYSDAGFSRSILGTDDPKTRASARRLAFSNVIGHALLRHRELVEQMKISAGKAWRNSDWLIPDSTGGPWNPNNALRQYKTFCRNNGVRVIRIHDLRHTSAAMGLAKGVRLEAVSQALGHSRIETTKSVYAPYVQPLVDEFTTAMEDSFNITLLVDHEREMSEWGNDSGASQI